MEHEEATRSASGLAPQLPTPVSLDRDIAFAEAERRLLGRELRPVTLDRFIVLHRLGQGAMGVVYAAHDPKLDRKVALKIVDTSGFGTEGVRDTRRRIEREARAAADLAHPNVVTIYDTGTVGDQVFLAMELVHGCTLRHWLRKEHGWREIVSMFVDIGQGLAAAHDKGIVHRDFKPDNVLVGDDGRPRVVDFGLARPVAASLRSSESLEAPNTARSGGADPGSAPATGSPDTSIAGTPAYMSPEQYEGRDIGPHSDQFGFCVALYEALLGQRPFAGHNASALAAAVLTDRRLPMPRGHGVPPSVLAVVQRGLAHDRHQRYPSMEHLIVALRTARDRRRRRLGALAGAVLVGGSVLATYALAPREGPAPLDPCAHVEAPLTEVWNDDRRAAIAATMADVSPYSAGAWQAIEPKIDRFAARWTDQRRDACNRAQHRGEESVLLLELRYACLDRALLRMSVFLEQLDAPGPMTPMLGPTAADGVDQLWRCEDRERLVTTMHGNGLADETDLSRSRDGLAQWKAGYARLAHAEMSFALAQAEPAIEEARAVVESAKAAGLRALEAEARLAVGRWGHEPEQLERALDLAVASSTPSQAAEIAVAIAEQAADGDPSQLAPARQHLRDAERFLARAGTSYDGSIAVRIPAVRGRLAVRANDNPTAIAEYERALAMARERLPPDHGDTLTILGNLGVARTESGDTAGATAIYEELLQTQIRVLGPKHPDVGSSAFNAGSAALEDRRLDDAERWFVRARDAWNASLGPEHPRSSWPLLALGEIHRRRGELEQARAVLVRARVLQERTMGADNPVLAYVLDELGELAVDEGDPTTARGHFEHALTLRRRAGGPDLSITLTKFGRMLATEADPSEAIALLEEALALRSADGVDPLKRAETELALAHALLSVDRGRAAAMAEAALTRLRAAEGRREQERAEAERWYAATFDAPR